MVARRAEAVPKELRWALAECPQGSVLGRRKGRSRRLAGLIETLDRPRLVRPCVDETCVVPRPLAWRALVEMRFGIVQRLG